MKKILLFAVLLPLVSFAENMVLAKIPKCEAWKLPQLNTSSEVLNEWHEMDGGSFFTNSVGDKVSVSTYCAMLSCSEEDAYVPLLDKYYMRCHPNAIKKMHPNEKIRDRNNFWSDYYVEDKDGNVIKGEESSGLKLTTWLICKNIFLEIEADNAGMMKCRTYRFIIYNGSERRTIATFTGMPTHEQIDALLSVLTNPDAVNNVAVMYHEDYAETGCVDDEYIVRLLTLAAQFGSVAACENLVILGKERKWSESRIERWRIFAEASRKAIKAGYKPKMEIKDLSEWPLSYICDHFVLY